jgi:hypothetical protein
MTMDLGGSDDDLPGARHGWMDDDGCGIRRFAGTEQEPAILIVASRRIASR